MHSWYDQVCHGIGNYAKIGGLDAVLLGAIRTVAATTASVTIYEEQQCWVIPTGHRLLIFYLDISQ